MKKVILSLLLSITTLFAFSQVTTSAISGVVRDPKNQVLPGATVSAIHVPTGTVYKAATNKSGAYVFPAVRVGGPYTITASYVGFKTDEVKDVATSLGVTSNVDFYLLDQSTTLKEVVVSGTRQCIL